MGIKNDSEDYMKKRLLVLVMVMTVILTACSKGTDKTELKCEFKPEGTQVTLVPGEKFDAEDMGETTAYLEAASCYYEGMDKIFTYEGYEVTTYPLSDGDYIQDISISDASIKMSGGIGIGSSLADVEAALGSDYTLAGKLYKYYVDDSKYLYFFIMDDVVKYYGYATEVR